MITPRDRLARYAHNTWSGWMKYMFSRSTIQKDGSLLIPPDLVRRWQRQMHTSYRDLPPEEQKSDLDEANRILEIMENHQEQNESD